MPTLGLALRLAGDEGDWRALRSDGALRRARVLALGDAEGRLTERPLRLEEPALLYLQGIVQIDERLSALALPPGGGAAREAEAFPEALAALEGVLTGRRVLAGVAPTAEIASDELPAGIAVACAALARAGFGAVTVPLSMLPQDAEALRACARRRCAMPCCTIWGWFSSMMARCRPPPACWPAGRRRCCW